MIATPTTTGARPATTEARQATAKATPAATGANSLAVRFAAQGIIIEAFVFRRRSAGCPKEARGCQRAVQAS
ncbi:hypothetical protein HMPREF0972_00533 [Actinomyces sp. oral taxon 848 str. F0332]|nr:hypothetical protein HMPREF0972_00533 [Actinomyces sp. oral taxon 848 str. F0332]